MRSIGSGPCLSRLRALASIGGVTPRAARFIHSVVVSIPVRCGDILSCQLVCRQLFDQDFRYGPIAVPATASTEPPVPSASSSTRPTTSTTVILPNPGRLCGPLLASLVTDHVMHRHRRRAAVRCSIPVLPVQDSGSGRMPRESLDAPENLAKEASCQVALSQLEDEVPACRMRRPPGLNSRCCLGGFRALGKGHRIAEHQHPQAHSRGFAT